ncbi:MAG: ABC transporter ATP-binding protein [Firmicutes bacterium]|nr:ABC transporter ATP-binding protein [Bacillota bacterium]
MKKKILEIKDLYVEYITEDGIVHAVNGLNLELEKGQTLGLVGETGAGKTTTVLSIMKLLPEQIGRITKGTILLDGNNITDLRETEMQKLRGNAVSMIFQDPMTSLNPVLSVGDQIAEVLELHQAELGKKRIDERVDEILDMVGLQKERKVEYPHQFSGGMKQRIVIAMALACEPKLLLADEPTTALDVTIQAQVLEMMNRLKDTFSTSMMLITHDLGVVAQTCDSVAIMYAGRVIEQGTLKDIYTAGRHHPYTIGLFNSIPDLTKDTKRLSPIKGLMPDPINLPNGCAFHPRCPECLDVCRYEMPEESCYGTHKIRCHLYK